MRFYSGGPGQLAVINNNGKKKPLAPSIAKKGFAWGKPDIEAHKAEVRRERPNATRDEVLKVAMERYRQEFQSCTRLALAILCDALDGDEAKAVKFYTRFKDHVIANWSVLSAWSIRQSDVLAFVKESEANWEETATTRRMAAQEPAPVRSEFGGDVVWHKDR